MKTLLIAGLGVLAAACAQLPPTEDLSFDGYRPANDGIILTVWRGRALPQQVIGEENHQAVLDGRS